MDIRKQLIDQGKARQRAKAQAEIRMRTIARLAPRALEQGLTKMEVCKLAQISRPALDAILRNHE